MQTVKVQQSDLEERRSLAREQSALFPTQLALARWTNGADLPHLHNPQPPRQAIWLAQAQRDFQSWLDGGGFVQHEAPANDPKPDDGLRAKTQAI
jgi:hypothetical protein